MSETLNRDGRLYLHEGKLTKRVRRLCTAAERAALGFDWVYVYQEVPNMTEAKRPTHDSEPPATSDREQAWDGRSGMGRGPGDISYVETGNAGKSAHAMAVDRELDGDRNRREAREAVGRAVHQREMDFAIGVGKVMQRAYAFAEELKRSIGREISRDEAIDTLKREIGEQLERLRVGML